MKLKLHFTAVTVQHVLWQILCLVISISLFSVILTNRSPNFLRPVSMALRTGFGLVIPITMVGLYLVFRLPGRSGYLAGMAITLSLFAMPLAGLWASGLTQTTVLSGIIPFYDAESYYIDALGLLNGSQFSLFSARRPLFPGLLAVLLSWTNHNLMTSLAILTAIAGLSCFLAAREIQRTHGLESAVFVLIILFMFFRAHSGISMSENLGLTFGVLGFAILWQGASRKSVLIICFGLFITTLALNARAGAFFMLPILILWAGWLFRENNWISWKSIILSTLSILLGFGLNLGLTRLIAVPSGVPFANFSYTLYGLASGGESWAYIFVAHPEVLLLQEPEQTRTIYQLAFELIRNHPYQAIQGALYNWKMLFSNTWYNIYAYIGGDNWEVNVLVSWGMYLLCLTGIFAWFQDRNDPIKSLIMASFCGILISVPFLPPTDAYRMRPYAASIIILAALPSLGFHLLLKRFKLIFFSEKMNEIDTPAVLWTFTIILVIVVLIGPVIIKMRSVPIMLKPISCKHVDLDFVLVRFDAGNYINIKKPNLNFLDWMPDYHVGQFRKNAHSLADPELINWSETLIPPITVFLSLDFNSNMKVLVAFKTETAPFYGKYYQFCGFFETSPSLNAFRIFYTDEIHLLHP